MVKNLGAGHWMSTHADLYDNNVLAAWTNTHTDTWFGGFIGTVVVAAYDAGGGWIAQTPEQRYGVDGTWVGRSNRTETWSHQFDSNIQVVGRATQLLAVHGFRFEPRILERIIQNAGTIAAIAALL